MNLDRGQRARAKVRGGVAFLQRSNIFHRFCASILCGISGTLVFTHSPKLVSQQSSVDAGEHIENTLEALSVLIDKDNSTPAGLPNLAYIEFDVHVSQQIVLEAGAATMLAV